MALLGCAAVGCLDEPAFDREPASRIVIAWEPASCGAPHRVAVELADTAGLQLAASAPCEAGSVTLDAPHFGRYLGRVYAWRAGEPIRSIMPLALDVDAPTVRWIVATPL